MTPPSQPPRVGALGGGHARYAFSGRADGTMSTSVGVGDVAAARAALAARVGLTADHLAWMRQVHGAVVARADEPAAEPPPCDGIITTTPGRGVGVLVADCVPVLVHIPGGVAAVHAGRAGVVADVVGVAVEELSAATGTPPTTAEAVIGPAIGPCCYEVPAAMADAVDELVPGTRARTTWGTPSLDLVAGVRSQLRARGVTTVMRAGGCTRCDDRWFSHRSTGGPEQRPAGRQAGVIALDRHAVGRAA